MRPPLAHAAVAYRFNQLLLYRFGFAFAFSFLRKAKLFFPLRHKFRVYIQLLYRFAYIVLVIARREYPYRSRVKIGKYFRIIRAVFIHTFHAVIAYLIRIQIAHIPFRGSVRLLCVHNVLRFFPFFQNKGLH